MYPIPDLEAAPSAGAKVQTFDRLEDLPKELKEEIMQDVPNRGAYELKAAVADAVDIFAEVDDYERQRSTRYFTGMQLTGKEYYFADVEYSSGSTRIGFGSYVRNLGVSSVEMEDASWNLSGNRRNSGVRNR